MAEDASEFEQIPDVQQAQDLYELAEQQLYGPHSLRGAHTDPPNPAYLQIMVDALQVRQLCRLNVLLETLIQRESTPHE